MTYLRLCRFLPKRSALMLTAIWYALLLLLVLLLAAAPAGDFIYVRL